LRYFPQLATFIKNADSLQLGRGGRRLDLAVLGGSESVGEVIFIGPVPIVFGAGPDAGWLIAVSAIITVVSLVFVSGVE